MSIWLFSLLGSSAGFTLGSVLLKRFADTGAWSNLSMSFMIFAASNLLFVRVLKGGLGSGVVASSMVQIILMAALGALIFGERLGSPQIIGVVLAAISVCLMIRPG